MQIRSLSAEVKSLSTDDPNGAFEVILSDPSTDRDGEVVDAKAFDPLPDHITFDIDHGMTVTTTVGSGTPYYDGDVLKVKGTYSSLPLAQDVRTLVNEGHIRSTSVAFLGAAKEVKSGATHITKAELLNGTFTPVPSNRGAIVLSSKGLKAGARNSAADAANLQQIHDLAVANGADCTGMAKSSRRHLKAVVGSYEDRQEDVQEAIVAAQASAIAAAYPDVGPGEYGYYVRIIATFDDRVVWQIGWDEDAAWQAAYTWDGETATLATPEPVEVDQVVTPVSTGKSAAPQDATGAGGEQEHLELRLHALRLLASAAS